MLLSPAPCMALLGTLMRSQQVGCVQCGTSLISLCLEVKRVLSSAVKSDGQSAVAIIYILYFGGVL